MRLKTLEARIEKEIHTLTVKIKANPEIDMHYEEGELNALMWVTNLIRNKI